MKIYDISQEVFGCRVYPTDPTPEREELYSIEKGDLYNLTSFGMCSHNGTHIDAPHHFIKDGKAVDELPLEAFVGLAYVAEHNGVVTEKDALKIIEKAKKQSPEAARRILIKGDAEVSDEAARIFAASNLLLLGNESQTVGNGGASCAFACRSRLARRNLFDFRRRRHLLFKCRSAEFVKLRRLPVPSDIDIRRTVK